MAILRMTHLDLAGKRVLIREDLNVPVHEGRVTSDQRILAALPTLKFALDQGAAVMVMSHLGRPTEGHWTAHDSLAPVAARLSELLGRPVPLLRDWLDGVDVQPGEIVLLENCRMNVGEAKDDSTLAQRYAMSGGYIRNAALRAAFRAAEEHVPLTHDHLERAIRAEFSEIGKLADSGVLE